MMHSYPCWVECVSCGADTPYSAPVDEDGAAAAWNTRANVAHATAPLQAEIEALRAQLDEQCRLHAIGMERELALITGRDRLRAEVATWEGLHASEVQVRQRWQARAERLAEALRKIAALTEEFDDLDDAVGIANEALEQEKGRG